MSCFVSPEKQVMPFKAEALTLFLATGYFLGIKKDIMLGCRFWAANS
ncbi:hypothetical protein GGQ60_002502 [Pedobacter zeae]|uniref:Uncharacterized protein n=1 Tax=Pedobacter zeae TaxID=1737356 RepID=A0A7W6KB40_9SPHI|nr:hypothetical protein [Pedobacter zeae]